MSEIAGQTALYTETAEDRWRRIESARRELQEAERELAEHHGAGRAKKLRVTKARAELMLAIAPDGAQRSFIVTPDEVLRREPGVAMTREVMHQKRLGLVRDAAMRALSACGGHRSNRELAQMLGQDSHGLASLLEGDGRVLKYHSGRDKNEQTQWKLTAEGEAWVAIDAAKKTVAA